MGASAVVKVRGSGGARNFQLVGGARELEPGHMASARSASLYWVWGQSLTWLIPHQGLCPGGESGGQSPLKLKTFSLWGDPSDKANLHPFRNFAKSQNYIYLLSYTPTGLSQDNFFPTPRESRNVCFQFPMPGGGRNLAHCPEFVVI